MISSGVEDFGNLEVGSGSYFLQSRSSHLVSVLGRPLVLFSERDCVFSLSFDVHVVTCYLL